MISPVDAIEPEKGPTNAVLLPVWQQGSSLLRSLGCLRWKSSTVTQTLLEFGSELDDLGVRRLVLLSSHGAMDHLQALERAAKVLQKKTRMNVLAPSGPLLNDFVLGNYHHELTLELGRDFTPEESEGIKGDVHAGAWETSLLLHIAPRLVEETYQTLPKHAIFEGRRLKLRALRYHRGYFGAPGVSSEELGRAAFDLLCGKMTVVLEEFLKKPLRHDHKLGLTHRRKARATTSSKRLAFNVALGLAAGWVLFRTLDKGD